MIANHEKRTSLVQRLKFSRIFENLFMNTDLHTMALGIDIKSVETSWVMYFQTHHFILSTVTNASFIIDGRKRSEGADV